MRAQIMTETGKVSQYLTDALNQEVLEAERTLEIELASVIDAHPIDPIVVALQEATHPVDYFYMPEIVLETSAAIEESHDRKTLGRYNKLVAIKLLYKFDQKVEKQNLPEGYKDTYPEHLSIWWQWLNDIDDDQYIFPEEGYVKDTRLLTERSVWFRNNVYDRDAWLRPTIYRYNGWKANLRCLAHIIFRTRGLGPFMRSHQDPRFIRHLPPGEKEAFQLDRHIMLGELFENNPRFKGLIGSGWMDDPNLHKVSPRYTLGYEIAKRKNTFRRRDGSNEISTQRAIATSKTRRAAYERGDYMPVVHTSIVPSQGLIRYGRKHKRRREKGLPDDPLA